MYMNWQVIRLLLTYSTILDSKPSVKYGYMYKTVMPVSVLLDSHHLSYYNGQSSGCMWHKKEVLKSCCSNLPAGPNQEKEVEVRVCRAIGS